jgi:hypothetical protein
VRAVHNLAYQGAVVSGRAVPWSNNAWQGGPAAGMCTGSEDGVMEQLRLPRLVGTREAVTDVLHEQGVPATLAGEQVAVLARDLASGSASFADELVKEVLCERGAAELSLVGAPERFVEHVHAAAVRRGVADKVHVRSAAELGV